MNSQVMEIIFFKTKSDVSDDVVKNAVEKTTSVLQQTDGFLSRQLGATQNREQWADILFWENLESAQKATSIFMEHPDCQEFINMVEEEQIQVIHLEVLM
jgi:hypothetical protein